MTRHPATQRPGHRLIAGLTAFAVAFGSMPLSVRAEAMSRAEYEACQARDETSFRAAIQSLTEKALQKGLAGFDYKAVVAEQWRRGDVDTVMTTRIDEVTDELREETSWLRLLETLASKDAAQKLATSAAERVYERSDAVKKAIEGIAAGVGAEVGKRIELATTDAAEPATQCVQAFLGPRYGPTIARTVSRDAGSAFAIDPAKGAAQISTGQVLIEGSQGITGAVVLLVRRQLANMASRVGQRLVGAVLGRLVSIVAGGVGLILIAKDVWDLRHGVLPIIAEEMKSPDTREKVQAELASSVAEQIGEHVHDIAAKAADRVADIWLEFRRAHAKVLEIAEKNEAFRSFLDSTAPNSLSRLDEVVALILASEGEPAVLKRLQDGTLREAVEKLSPPAFEIARGNRSLAAAFDWRALAGDALPKVVEYEVYRRNPASEFTKSGLVKILDLQDQAAISRLASLKLALRQPLLELDDANLKRLARALPETELAQLSQYLTGLEHQAGQRLLSAVAQSPAKMQLVSRPGVHDAILQSRDQSAAVGIMLRSETILDPIDFTRDIGLVRDGRISPWLLWARYPIVLSVLGFLALVLLALLGRLVFGRRARHAY